MLEQHIMEVADPKLCNLDNAWISLAFLARSPHFTSFPLLYYFFLEASLLYFCGLVLHCMSRKLFTLVWLQKS
jgi:hypothetical protein